jgi:hypothetical protein
VTKGAHPGIDPMCKQCWKDGRKARVEAVADAKDQGVAVPKRGRKAKVAEGGEESGAEEAPASSSFSSKDPSAPENTVPTVITELVDGKPIEVIHIQTGDNLNKKTWYRGLIGPLADVVKFFNDVFGRFPDRVYKLRTTWYFPMTDEEREITKGNVK